MCWKAKNTVYVFHKNIYPSFHHAECSLQKNPPAKPGLKGTEKQFPGAGDSFPMAGVWVTVYQRAPGPNHSTVHNHVFPPGYELSQTRNSAPRLLHILLPAPGQKTSGTYRCFGELPTLVEEKPKECGSHPHTSREQNSAGVSNLNPSWV